MFIAACLRGNPEMPIASRSCGNSYALSTACAAAESVALWTTATKLSGPIGVASRLYADTLARLLLVELMRLEQGYATTPPANRGGLTAWQVRRVCDFIEDNLAADIPLGACSADAAQPNALLPRVLGVSPYQYQLSRRIERAKVLLADPNRTVTDIAFDCGYSVPGSFATTFRRATGVTPPAFRRAL